MDSEIRERQEPKQGTQAVRPGNLAEEIPTQVFSKRPVLSLLSWTGIEGTQLLPWQVLIKRETRPVPFERVFIKRLMAVDYGKSAV